MYQDVSREEESPLVIWYRLGSICFIAALAVLAFKCAPLYAPFIGVSVLGYAAISLFRKAGLFVSLSGLALTATWYFFSQLPNFWLSVFLVVLGLSWFLIYAQKERVTQFVLSAQEDAKRTQSEMDFLKQQVAQLKKEQNPPKKAFKNRRIRPNPLCLLLKNA